ncbi:hypothetical protein ES703_48244 [subsurface metagenome]
MAKRISHGKAAGDEAKKAVLDAAGVALPDLSKARGIIGTIDHGEKAVYHTKKAAEKAVKSKIRKVKRFLGDPLNLNQPKRKRKSATKTNRRKTTARKKR